MNLAEQPLRHDVETFKTAPTIFGSTLKSFDQRALMLKRGFRVNRTLNSLRTLRQLKLELESGSIGGYAAISYRSAR